MIRGIGKSIIKLQFRTMLWRLRYYLGSVDDFWYRNLFKNKDNYTGDITPAYQLLTEQDVKHVYNIVPEAKIIFIIRNPIDRTWSQLRKNNQHKFEFDALRKVIHSDDIKWRNDYLRTMHTWKKYYPDSQFKVAFFDDLKNNPVKMMNEVVEFIKGTYSNDSNNKELTRIVNAARSSNMDNKTKRFLAEELLPLMEDQAKVFCSYAKLWYEEALKSLK